MATIQVTTTSDSGVGSLRDAVAKAQSGDKINFTLPANSTITLTSGEIAIPEAKNLTIDGTGVSNLTISGNNTFRIFNLKSNASTANQFYLKNLTLINGLAPAETPTSNGSPTDTSERGGAILLGSASTLTLDTVTFNDNNAPRGGGAIYSTSSAQLTVLSSKFNRNNGQGKNEERAGGAITFRGPNELIVRNSIFTANKGVNGGAINSVHGKLTLDSCQFIDNISDGVYDPQQKFANPDAMTIRGYGGAVYADRGHESTLENTGYIRIYRSIFQGNQGEGSGGAAYLFSVPGDEITVDSSTFQNNEVEPLNLKSGATLPTGVTLSPGNGGALSQVSNATLGANAGFSLTNSTFVNNKATNQGGGLWKNVSPATIINNTIVGNRAENLTNSTDNTEIGGGLMLYGQATVTNNTIANNFANWWGGGLAADTDTGVTVNNTIFSNNVGNRGGAAIKSGAHTNRLMLNGQNNIQFPNRTSASTDFLAVKGIRVIDPKLGSLQSNGGATQTMAVLPGSPAIDTGANLGALARDQRGVTRPTDGDGNGTFIRDIGAFEFSTDTTRPEVEATLETTNLADGTMTPINYGQTSVGTSITKTLTISNTGTGILALGGLQIPTGFSILGTLPSSITPNTQASVSLKFNALTSGLFGGIVILTTNDSNENPFSFAIKGSVSGVINGTAGADSISGLVTDERISGLDGNDTLQSNAGNDTVFGGNGNDVISSGVGLNSLGGGAGDDSYTLTNPLDVITEGANSSAGGIDVVNVAASYVLPTNVDNLILQSTGNFSGIGNSIRNILTGNSGNNLLIGGDGNDNLRGMDGNDTLNGGNSNDQITGGNGNDQIIYTNMLEAGDIINDFVAGQDKIDLDVLLTSIGYSGSNPIGDGYVRIISTTLAGITATSIQIDRDGIAGVLLPTPFITCASISASSINNSSNFIF